jgi:cyclic pyranopterin phosphate synthase
MSDVFPVASDAVMAPSGRISASGPAPLVDRFGRVHTDLRLSVTDRCTLRCTYCMPLDARFKPRDELLSFDEFERVVTVAARLGIRSIRVTGGEPLLRPRLPDLIARLVAVPGIEEVALTTNGLLLSEQAESLHSAGLHRVNVSLDALDDEAFRRIARADGLDRVLAGLAAAGRAGFRRIRVNAVSIRGLTEAQVVPLARLCRGAGFQLRFIEFMPLDAESGWSSAQVLTGAEVRSILEREFGPLEALPSADPGQPAVDWRWSDGASVGFIDPVSHPFCDRCDRLRLTADGQFRNCLFSTTEWDVRAVLRSGAADVDARLATLLAECTAAKRAAHGIGEAGFERPSRAMYQIGG